MSSTDTPTKPVNPSQYIRTYAKDVAALTGKTPAEIHARPEPASEPKRFAQPDESLMVSDVPAAQPPDLAELERDAELTNLDTQIKEVPERAPMTPAHEERSPRPHEEHAPGHALPHLSLPSIKFPEHAPRHSTTSDEFSPVQETTSTGPDGDREAILARLRAKVANYQRNPPPPIVETAAPTPAPKPMPEYVPPMELAPPVPLASEPILVPKPIPPPLPKPLSPQRPEPATPPPFHSYSSDFSDQIQKQHASTFAVLAAEKDAPQSKPAARKKNLKMLPLLAGSILILVSAGGVYAAYHYMSQSAPVAATLSAPSLITPDESVALSGTGTTLLDALAQQANRPLDSDEVLLTYTTQATTTTQGVIEAPATGGAFITALDLPAPAILLRNIDPTSMVGIINDGSQTRAFFILRVDSYDSTFAGMLAWEPTLGSDLATLYPSYPVVSVDQNATTTTATASAPQGSVAAPITTTYAAIPPEFIDEVVANHNARALKDSEGRTILIYGYADAQTLIIARDEEAFTLLLNRLQSSQS